MSDHPMIHPPRSEAALPAPLPLGRIMAVILPGLAVLLGLGFWLWGRHGETVWFDAAAAFIAGCFG